MLEAIATYADGAGQWRVTREGDTLTIHTPNGEALTYRATRAPEYDAQLVPGLMLTDRFASCDDLGTEGVVWIDGEGYTLNTY